MNALARAQGVLPAEALLLDAGTLGFGTNMLVRVGGTMGLAEGVPAGNEGHCLLVIHRHARERFSDVQGRSERVRFTIWPLRVHVDQAHLNGAERVHELTVAAVALVVLPLGLRPPVDVPFGLPDIRAAATEAVGLEPHRLESDIAGENHQIGPGNLPAVLLFDGPEQPARLIEAHVVRPAIEGRKALRARRCTAAAVGHAVRARTMPGHADEERTIVAVVRRPPVLRIRHQGMKVPDHGIKVETREFFRVVKLRAHGIGQGRVLVKNLQVQLLRPPVCVLRGPSHCVSASVARHWALGFRVHAFPPISSLCSLPVPTG